MEVIDDDLKQLVFWAHYGIRVARGGHRAKYTGMLVEKLSRELKLGLGDCELGSLILDFKIKRPREIKP